MLLHEFVVLCTTVTHIHQLGVARSVSTCSINGSLVRRCYQLAAHEGVKTGDPVEEGYVKVLREGEWFKR